RAKSLASGRAAGVGSAGFAGRRPCAAAAATEAAGARATSATARAGRAAGSARALRARGVRPRRVRAHAVSGLLPPVGRRAAAIDAALRELRAQHADEPVVAVGVPRGLLIAPLALALTRTAEKGRGEKQGYDRAPHDPHEGSTTGHCGAVCITP